MTEPPHPPSTSQQLVDQLVDSAIADRETLRAERVAVPSAVTRQRAVRLALVAAIPILIAVLLASFAQETLLSVFDYPPAPAMASRQAQEMLDALVVEIDAFRRDYDELPATLVDVGVPSRGQWSYAVSGRGQYRVEGTLYGQTVSFDSTRAAARPAGQP